MNKNILKLLQSDQALFNVNELSVFINHKTEAYLRNRISFYKKSGILKRVAKGIYSISGKKYNNFELANKIYSPSYISFFSALYYHGIIFQYQNDVYVAYKKTDTKKFETFNIILKNLKADLLFNSLGIEKKGFFFIASPERALLDTIYLFGDIHFDNLDLINWEKAKSLLSIYNSKKLEKLFLTYIPKKI